jgi:hypothetical protein
MDSLGITTEEIDIRPSSLQMLKDLRHPYAQGQPVYDVTFENVQAGDRTSHLFRLANQHQALVVGTSDLSELALGWCTYGVGDQMTGTGCDQHLLSSGGGAGLRVPMAGLGCRRRRVPLLVFGSPRWNTPSDERRTTPRRYEQTSTTILQEEV